MDISTLIMLAAAFLFFIAVYLKTPASATEGLQAAFYLFLEVLPRMAAALIVAGLIQVLVPQEVIARWMGQESGLQGLFIANALGALTPGGPMSQFPIIASLYKIGIGIGPLVAYMTAWSLMGFQRIIIWELPFLGPRVVAVRVFASILFPVLAGRIAQILWARVAL